MNALNADNSKSNQAMTPELTRDLVLAALDDAKAQDVVVIDVTGKTSITDFMIITSGTSSRHLKTLTQSVMSHCKQAGCEILGSEGDSGSEWLLVDLGDVLLHAMLPQTRTYYNLESIWQVDEPVTS